MLRSPGDLLKSPSLFSTKPLSGPFLPTLLLDGLLSPPSLLLVLFLRFTTPPAEPFQVAWPLLPSPFFILSLSILPSLSTSSFLPSPTSRRPYVFLPLSLSLFLQNPLLCSVLSLAPLGAPSVSPTPLRPILVPFLQNRWLSLPLSLPGSIQITYLWVLTFSFPVPAGSLLSLSSGSSMLPTFLFPLLSW